MKKSLLPNLDPHWNAIRVEATTCFTSQEILGPEAGARPDWVVGRRRRARDLAGKILE